ncbi:MAG TPA: Dyp-type peroxidase [Stellaceae bacterium]|nr:Dyp-type peroxidase [Stellaceae bacterium]
MPTTSLNLDQIQGNILAGFNKDFQANLFLKFTGDAAGRAWIKEISDEVAASSSAEVIEFNNQFAALKAQGVARPEELIAAIWVNLALSFTGLKALAVKAADLAAFPQAFRDGMAQRKTELGDVGASDPSHWVAPFSNPDDVHAVLIVAADHAHALQQKVDALTGTAAFKAGVEILRNQPGRTRPDLPGHEHFGFKDGISQPGIRGVDPPDDPIGNPNQGHPGQDLLWPGEFVIGYATQIAAARPGADGPNPDPGPDSPAAPAWTADGSYLVFRRLRQDAAGFENHVAQLAETLGWSIDLTGAKLVGRYKSGAPIAKRKFQPGPYTPPSTDPGDPHHGNPELANNNELNNNFEFADDPQGTFCPLAGHIRKAYPRDEVTPAGPENSESSTQKRRLIRRGIPYGPPFDPHDPASAQVDRGLLFFCYQSDIESHFEFVQKNWVNNPAFPPNPPGAANLPGPPGEDAVIAQSASATMLIDPTKAPVEIRHFVTTTGGEYFFSPSVKALQAIGDGSI